MEIDDYQINLEPLNCALCKSVIFTPGTSTLKNGARHGDLRALTREAVMSIIRYVNRDK